LHVTGNTVVGIDAALAGTTAFATAFGCTLGVIARKESKDNDVLGYVVLAAYGPGGNPAWAAANNPFVAAFTANAPNGDSAVASWTAVNKHFGTLGTPPTPPMLDAGLCTAVNDNWIDSSSPAMLNLPTELSDRTALCASVNNGPSAQLWKKVKVRCMHCMTA
jgi:hypothetical protein